MLNIELNPSLAKRTTLHLGGTAIAELKIDDKDALNNLEPTLKELGGRPYVLGAGSNILAHDGQLPIVLLRSKFCDKPSIIDENNERVLVKVGTGLKLSSLLSFCIKNNLQGLEGLCGIPGSIGGAIAMNAGSFGSETCKNLHSLEFFSPTNGIRNISRNCFNYNYRKFKISNINSWFLLMGGIFSLTRCQSGVIKEKVNLNFFQKKSKQPITKWSAGCTFKNPNVEQPAGKLLDMCGFKGKNIGGMRFSNTHANFLINDGHGKASEALELIEQAKNAVQKEFNIALQLEVQVLK